MPALFGGRPALNVFVTSVDLADTCSIIPDSDKDKRIAVLSKNAAVFAVNRAGNAIRRWRREADGVIYE
jgi:hypothetical protein